MSPPTTDTPGHRVAREWATEYAPGWHPTCDALTSLGDRIDAMIEARRAADAVAAEAQAAHPDSPGCGCGECVGARSAADAIRGTS